MLEAQDQRVGRLSCFWGLSPYLADTEILLFFLLLLLILCDTLRLNPGLFKYVPYVVRKLTKNISSSSGLDLVLCVVYIFPSNHTQNVCDYSRRWGFEEVRVVRLSGVSTPQYARDVLNTR